MLRLGCREAGPAAVAAVDDLGLINMRGRIYDPRLGRFLSTDPIVSNRHFGQSWNPYSYVHNSPLNFTDPSGFDGVGTYENLVGLQGQFPVPDVSMLADPASGVAPQVKPPSATGDTWSNTRRTNAATDDGPAHVPPAVAEGSPFAPPPMPAMPELVPDPPSKTYAPEGRDRGRGFLFGLSCGLTPGCGPVHQLAMETGLVKSGSEDLRLGNALGQILGGAILTVIGGAGDAVGGAVGGTGVGAPVGVLVIAGSSSLVVAGEANVTAGLGALSQVLQSSGSGGTTGAPKAGASGGPGAGKRFPESVKERAREESKGRCVFCDTETTSEPGPKRSEVDHSIPRSRGGNNSPKNAQNTCRTCNRQKGARTSEEFSP